VTGIGLLRQGRQIRDLFRLVALAISIAVHCEGRVAYPTKMAHQYGATREDVVETVAVALYVRGGPSPPTPSHHDTPC